MAEYYGKLRASITRSESKPKLKLTEQTWSEASIVYTGKIEGVPVWFGLLIPFHKYADLKNNLKNQTINLIKISRFINYRDDQEKLLTMFGWGKEPPKLIKIWLNSNYDLPTIDENINVIYEKDDIRLCTIQRSTPNQLIGIRFCYYRQDQFHYIQLLSHSKLSLAYRAGLRNYDRIISINGTNVEQDRPKQPSQRLKAQRHLPLQILVSSPATYAFYKSNKMILHENLPSVQHLTPVFDTHSQSSGRNIQITSISDTTFCIVQLEENKNICTIPQTAIFKSPDDTNINDICFVEVEQKQYRKARILFIGSYIHCQRWNETTNIDFDLINCYSTSLVDKNNLTHLQKSLQENDNKNQNKDNCEEQILQRLEINQDTNERIDTILEQLPNELFFYLFNFLDASNLYGAFWGLNSRFNKLLQSCQNLTLIYEDSNDSSMLQYYSSRINGLTVDTSNICDFNQFPNLQKLTLYNRSSEHLSQIKPEILSNLTFLSFMLESDFKVPTELIKLIFSDKFPYLRYAKLGRIDQWTSLPCSSTSSLQFVSISSDQPLLIVSIVLDSCPNLKHLRLQVLPNSRASLVTSPPTNHSLQRLTLWSDYVVLSCICIDILLSHMLNIRHFYLQTICHTPFMYLAENILNRLQCLSRFECYVKEIMNTDNRIGNLSTVHQLHPNFNRIQCIAENDKFRIFATK